MAAEDTPGGDALQAHEAGGGADGADGAGGGGPGGGERKKRRRRRGRGGKKEGGAEAQGGAPRPEQGQQQGSRPGGGRPPQEGRPQQGGREARPPQGGKPQEGRSGRDGRPAREGREGKDKRRDRDRDRGGRDRDRRGGSAPAVDPKELALPQQLRGLKEKDLKPEPSIKHVPRRYGLAFYETFQAAKADLAMLAERAEQYDQLNVVIRQEGNMDDPELNAVGRVKVFAGTAWALIHERRKQDGWYDEPR